MAYRSIDFEHCLRRYQGASCHRCEMICPNKAIHDGQIDEPLCDDCGLCTAVCPMGLSVHRWTMRSCLCA